YEHYRLIEAFQDFDDELSNWYLRRSRRRFWQSGPQAYQTLYSVLTAVTKVMAPALPFLSEEIYQNLVCAVDPEAPESVHLTRYPEVDAAAIDAALEENIAVVIRIRNLALNLRMLSKVKVRQPLSVLYLRPRDAAERRVVEQPEYAAQILEETNVKKLMLLDDESALVRRRFRVDTKKVGPRAGRHLKAIGQAVEQADPQRLLAGTPFALEIDGQAFELAPDEIVVGF